MPTRLVIVPAAIAAAGLTMASAAWACAGHNRVGSTVIESCTAPAGTTTVCKAAFGTQFPEATYVKGPAGSRIVAYTEAAVLAGEPFDLLFADQFLLERGAWCLNSDTVLAGSVIADATGALPPTVATIPFSAPVGRHEVCFVHAATRHTDSVAAAGRDVDTPEPANFAPARFAILV